MRAKRVDQNHGQIVNFLRDIGCEVLDLSAVGRGCPDLLVYRPSTRLWRLVEVKVPKGKINALQAEFATRWPVEIVRSIDDAIKAVT